MSQEQLDLATMFPPREGGPLEDSRPAGELPQPDGSKCDDDRMSFVQQALGTFFLGFRAGFKRLRSQRGSLIHDWFTYDPPSVEQQIDYRDRRSWVPPGYERGGLDKAGTSYQNWFAIPAIALLNVVIWHIERGTRMAILATIMGVLTVITLIAWVALSITHH